MRISRPCSLLSLLSSALLFSALLLAACERAFDAPPPAAPQIIIDKVTPSRAFAGQAVTITGSHFGALADEITVSFGTQPAAVVRLDETPSGEDRLLVEVPLLNAVNQQQEASLKVARADSQTTWSEPFVYRGPGHLVQQRIFESVSFAATPILAAAAPPSPLKEPTAWPDVVLLGLDSKSLATLDLESHVRFEFGLCETPISAAQIFDTNQICHLVSSLQISAGGSPNATRLQSLCLGVEGAAGFAAADHISLAEGFMPLLIWSFCQSEDCLDQAFFISDSARPRALFHDPSGETSWDLGEPDGSVLNDCRCQGANPERIVSLAQDRIRDQSLFAVLDKGPWIWRIDPRTHVTPDAGRPHGPSPECAWPNAAAVIDSETCLANFIALTARQDDPSTIEDEFRLYALDAVTEEVVEFERLSESQLPSGGALRPTGRKSGPFPGAFALSSARFGDQRPVAELPDSTENYLQTRVYVANPDGLVGLDTEGTGWLKASVRVNLPSAYAAPQSLTTGESLRFDPNGLPEDWIPDHVIFADPAGDQVAVFKAGQEYESLQLLSMGRQRPDLAAASDGRTFFLSEPTHDTVRIIDSATQLELRAFMVHPTLSFGSLSPIFFSGGIDVFLLGLTDPTDFGLSAIAAWSTGPDLLELPDCEDSRIQQPEIALRDHFFDRMLLLHSDPEQLALIGYPRYDEHDVLQRPGHVRFIELKPQGQSIGEILSGPIEDFDPEIDDKTLIAKLDPYGRASAVLEAVVDPDQPEHWQAWLRILDRQTGPVGERIALELSELVAITDMALLVEEHDSMQTSYTLFLTQTHYAGLLLIRVSGSEVTRHFISTGVFPALLQFSPDTRRLYVGHAGIPRLSIVNLDCPHPPHCVHVERSIDLSAVPSKLTSSASGAYLYVTHAEDNRVSVIE